MTIKKVAFSLVISTFLFVSTQAQAAEENTRYLVKTNASFWKKSFNVRNSFDGGFTADLTDWQLKLVKLFNVEIEPVKKLNILDLTTVLSKLKPGQRQKPSESIPWGIKAVYSDDNLEKPSGGAEAIVAILDTGVVKHPDLKNRIKDCKDFTFSARSVIEGKCDDKNGHGTHVAGIIAADGGDDGRGIYGVAPEASLFIYKVCANNGSCWADDVAAGLRTAVDSGANIVVLGLGADASSALITEAVAYAVEHNALVMAGAGNDGPYKGSIDYPAADPNVISVGALAEDYEIPDWSSLGDKDKSLEFVAPGVNIESTGKDGNYITLSGTSMATPHVAGLAAKLWQKDSKNPATATRELLRKFASDILPTGYDNMSGWGMPKL